MTGVLSLAQCGGDEGLLVLRLQTILELATGLSGEVTKELVNAVSGDVYPPGANVRFSKDHIRTAERVAMWVDNGKLCLAVWPGELAAQYRRLYADSRLVDDLIALCDQPQWELNANFHLAFPHSNAAHRWYPRTRRHCTGAEYVKQWVVDFNAGCAGARTYEKIADPTFWQWLVERRYADTEDRATFEVWLEKQPKKRPIHIRPGVQVLRSWSIQDARNLDSHNELIPEVSQSIKEVLTALGEPTAREPNVPS